MKPSDPKPTAPSSVAAGVAVSRRVVLAAPPLLAVSGAVGGDGFNIGRALAAEANTVEAGFTQYAVRRCRLKSD